MSELAFARSSGLTSPRETNMISYNVLPFYQKKDKKLKESLVRAKHFSAPRLPDDSYTNNVNSACLRKPAVLDPAILNFAARLS
jgi:hypothetical protein